MLPEYQGNQEDDKRNFGEKIVEESVPGSPFPGVRSREVVPGRGAQNGRCWGASDVKTFIDIG